MKKWIIFDVMGVIFTVGDDTNDLLFPFVQQRNKFITREELNNTYMDASLGKITSEEFWRRTGICQRGDEQEVCKEYLDTCLKIDENFMQIARRLKNGYNLAVLSNDVSEWSAYLREKFAIDDVIEFSIISGDVKCRKPDIEIYQLAVNKAKVNAADCVFIDDRDKNLIPAMDLGMKVIRFLRDDDSARLRGVQSISSFLELENMLKNIWKV